MRSLCLRREPETARPSQQPLRTSWMQLQRPIRMPCTSENQNLQLGLSLRSTTISTAPIFIQQQSTNISITLILIPKNYQQPNINSSQLLKWPHSQDGHCRWDNNLPHDSFVEPSSRARICYHNHPKSCLYSIMQNCHTCDSSTLRIHIGPDAHTRDSSTPHICIGPNAGLNMS